MYKIEKSLTLYDIATKDVVAVDLESSLDSAIDSMYRHGLRDIVVIDDKNQSYFILTIREILEQGRNNLDKSIGSINLKEADVVSKDCLVGDAIKKFGMNFEYMCIVEDKKLMGIVSRSDLIANYDPAELVEYEKIENFIFHNVVKFVSKNTKMRDAISFIGDDLDDCLIVQHNGIPIGIITVMDILKVFVDKSDLDRFVDRYMTAPLQTVQKNLTVKEVIEYLNNKHFKRAVVADGDRILGIISQGDITRLIYNKWMDYSRRSIEVAKKALKYRDMAMIDSLTKAYNRNKFYEIIEQEKNRIVRYGTKTYSVIMCDLDHFKNINDIYGHHIGDMTLKQIADIIKRCIRKVDFLFRWGGDEFVILLPQTDENGAVAVANKIRDAINSTDFLAIDSITCSLGVSSCSDGSVADDIVALADRALYVSKNGGRDKVTFL